MPPENPFDVGSSQDELMNILSRSRNVNKDSPAPMGGGGNSGGGDPDSKDIDAMRKYQAERRSWVEAMTEDRDLYSQEQAHKEMERGKRFAAIAKEAEESNLAFDLKNIDANTAEKIEEEIKKYEEEHGMGSTNARALLALIMALFAMMGIGIAAGVIEGIEVDDLEDDIDELEEEQDEIDQQIEDNEQRIERINAAEDELEADLGRQGGVTVTDGDPTNPQPLLDNDGNEIVVNRENFNDGQGDVGGWEYNTDQYKAELEAENEELQAESDDLQKQIDSKHDEIADIRLKKLMPTVLALGVVGIPGMAYIGDKLGKRYDIKQIDKSITKQGDRLKQDQIDNYDRAEARVKSQMKLGEYNLEEIVGDKKSIHRKAAEEALVTGERDPKKLEKLYKEAEKGLRDTVSGGGRKDWRREVQERIKADYEKGRQAGGMLR